MFTFLMTDQQEYASIPGLLASYSGPLNYINKEGKSCLINAKCTFFKSSFVFLLYTIAVNAVYGLVEALMGNFDVGVSLIQLSSLVTGLRRRIYKEFV